MPTEQGYYEPDVSELVRAKAYQQFGFGRISPSSCLTRLTLWVLLAASSLPGFWPLISGPERRRAAVAELLRVFLLDKDGRDTAERSSKFCL